MNKIYKSFVVVFILTVVIAVAGVAWYRVSRQEIVVDNSTDVESKEVVGPPPTAVAKDEPVEGADPRVLLYSNGRHAGDVRYYGSEPDVINIRDALTRQTLPRIFVALVICIIWWVRKFIFITKRTGRLRSWIFPEIYLS